jgi:hypothetical protein
LEVILEGVGGLESVTTTPAHPFWVVDRGWVFAAELRQGDFLESADGSELQIFEIAELDEIDVVYNFHVADFNTYFIGEMGGLVHNESGGPCAITANLQEAAAKAADSAQSTRPRSGAAGGLEVDGQVFTNSSVRGADAPELHQDVQAVLDRIPQGQRGAGHGRCAEPCNLSDALRAGKDSRVTGGTSDIRKVKAPGNPKHAEPIPACSSCEILHEAFNVVDLNR